jgi:hypothetical protein
MRLPCCLRVLPNKAGIVEPEQTAVARQRFGKHVPAATNTHAAIQELLDSVFYMWSVS